jgi:dihydrofolate reductase
MRKVTAGLFHSIDGVVEAPDQWQFDQFDDELGAMFTGVQKRTDTVILGRKGYEEWSAYWPTAELDGDIADFLNGVTKFVASKTLKGPLTWTNSSLIEGDVPAFVRALKAKEGGEIAVMGGIEIVRSLFLSGVIDELTLITHPVVAGEGRRHLFQPGDPVTRLTLISEHRTSKGNVIATYGLRP